MNNASPQDFLKEVLEYWVICCLRSNEEPFLLKGKPTKVLLSLARYAGTKQNAIPICPSFDENHPIGYCPQGHFLWADRREMKNEGVIGEFRDTDEFYTQRKFWKYTQPTLKIRASMPVPAGLKDMASLSGITLGGTTAPVRHYLVCAQARTKREGRNPSTLWLALVPSSAKWKSLIEDAELSSEGRIEYTLRGPNHAPASQSVKIVRPANELPALPTPSSQSFVPLFNSNQFDTHYGGIHGSIRRRGARNVRVQYLSSDFVRFLDGNTVNDLLRDGGHVSLLGPHPDSLPLAEKLVALGRYASTARALEAIGSRRKTISELKMKYPKRFQVRWYSDVPPICLFIVNPGQPDGFSRVKLMLSKTIPVNGIRSLRPSIVIPNKMPYWPQYFQAQWEAIWKSATQTLRLLS